MKDQQCFIEHSKFYMTPYPNFIWFIHKYSMSIILADMRPQPYIVQQPEAIVALRGDNVSLVCIAATTSDAELTVVWRKDTKQLKDANPLNIASKGPGDINEFTSVLSLPNVNDDNQGRYQCVFINEFGKVSTRKVKVTVHGKMTVLLQTNKKRWLVVFIHFCPFFHKCTKYTLGWGLRGLSKDLCSFLQINKKVIFLYTIHHFSKLA